eukprot:CAMPEP_0118929744 /NCGR_PEP_ID=MMETSP1169-20130426/6655_1 /TAXON_ID=36882 /ORGANISM="Pyramimonas obovata, Strain CCMP722" /LENGTH=85 /DNA_ID=CAMNT_0006871993 /DNA_START=410 /DNA_END=664 /DNA_ORIENTATION=+
MRRSSVVLVPASASASGPVAAGTSAPTDGLASVASAPAGVSTSDASVPGSACASHPDGGRASVAPIASVASVASIASVPGSACAS